MRKYYQLATRIKDTFAGDKHMLYEDCAQEVGVLKVENIISIQPCEYEGMRVFRIEVTEKED